ncbi:ribonuclease H-like domain-containing protein [Tanacetum coccineum]
MKRVNIFVEMDTDLVEGSSKKTGTELEQEDKETSELQSLIEVVPGEKEVAIDAIPLATKLASIVDFKIHREGKKGYYELIRADGSSKIYLVFSLLLKNDYWNMKRVISFLSSSQNSSRINEVFGSILLVIMELLMKKLEILKKNMQFRRGLLGLKAFLKFLLLSQFMHSPLRSHLEIGLKVDAFECNILLTDPPLILQETGKGWYVETMFEKYNFAGVFIQIQAVLTLYAQGAYKVVLLGKPSDRWRVYGVITGEIGENNYMFEVPRAGNMTVKGFIKESFGYKEISDKPQVNLS